MELPLTLRGCKKSSVDTLGKCPTEHNMQKSCVWVGWGTHAGNEDKVGGGKGWRLHWLLCGEQTVGVQGRHGRPKKRLRLKLSVRCQTPCFTNVETEAQRSWAAAPVPLLGDLES